MTRWQLSGRRPRAWLLVAATALLGLSVALGSCGTPDPASTDSAASSTDGTSSAQSPSPIAGTGLPQLVDLGSEGCVPCDMMADELKALAEQYKGSLDVVVIDVNKTEKGATLARAMRVLTIPTQIFLDPNGNELSRHEGYISKDDMVREFEKLGYPLQRGFGSSDRGIGGLGLRG